MTDLRALTPHSLRESFASGIERRGDAAQKFVDEMQTAMARGETPSPHHLAQGEALLEVLDRDIATSVHNVVIAASHYSDATLELDALQSNLERVEDSANSLRQLLMTSGSNGSNAPRA